VFLQAVSIVFFTETWRPDSFYPRILANRQRGLHTLCLLDIKVKEPSLESLARGRKVVFLTHRLYTCTRAAYNVVSGSRF
jgi:diphthamide biosynthesis methyltransferase